MITFVVASQYPILPSLVVVRQRPATQYGEVAGHVDSILLADDVRLDRFHGEPMVFRKSSEIRL